MNAYARTQSGAQRGPSHRLVIEHADMARRIAMRVARRVPPWISADDLVAAAMVGLAEAADRWDPRRNDSFIAFAEPRVRGAVIDELRRGDLLSRRARTAARKVGETLRELEGKLGRAPEDEEIAAALGVSVDSYRDKLEELSHVSVVDFDPGVHDRQGHDAGPEGIAEKNELSRRLKDALQTLPPRDARILSLYYVEELSYAEIGGLLGVTESRVCQLHARAIARLRVELVPAGEGEDEGDDEPARPRARRR